MKRLKKKEGELKSMCEKTLGNDYGDLDLSYPHVSSQWFSRKNWSVKKTVRQSMFLFNLSTSRSSCD